MVLETRSQFESRHSWHFDVGEKDVRLVLRGSCQTLLAIFGDSDYLDVRFEVEYPAKAPRTMAWSSARTTRIMKNSHRTACRSLALFRLSPRVQT